MAMFQVLSHLLLLAVCLRPSDQVIESLGLVLQLFIYGISNWCHGSLDRRLISMLELRRVPRVPRKRLVSRTRVQVGINSTALIQGDPAGRITPTARHHGPLVRPLGPHRFRMVVWRLHTDVIILVHTDEVKV